jgi:NAD(P) transhydrogenase subunit alpha
MRRGSVIVDLAVEMGGNVEGSVVGETVEVSGVKIIGEANLPARVPGDASRMFARNVQAFLNDVLIDKAGNLVIKWDDEIVKQTVVTHGGEVVHAASREAISAKGTS